MRDPRRIAGTLTLILGLLAVCAGCRENARVLRLATYPPDFHYISDDELTNVMWRLAASVRDLEQLTAADEPDIPALESLLERIDREAKQLEPDAASSNHPYLKSQLRDFLGHVERARMALHRTPPDVTSADEVWRACSGCHDRS